LKIKTGPAEIMVLYPSGDFGYVACYLIRQTDGAVLISRGDGFVVKIGKWIMSNDSVTITSRTVYREIAMLGRAIPSPENVEQFRGMSRDGYWYLKKNKARYEPARRFEDLDFLAGVIACDRDYYDGEKHHDGPQPCFPTTGNGNLH
jgi:hypothetical protein